MAGKFRGVLILVIFVIDRQSRKFPPTKINEYEYAHAHKRQGRSVGVAVSRLMQWTPASVLVF